MREILSAALSPAKKELPAKRNRPMPSKDNYHSQQSQIRPPTGPTRETFKEPLNTTSKKRKRRSDSDDGSLLNPQAGLK